VKNVSYAENLRKWRESNETLHVAEGGEKFPKRRSVSTRLCLHVCIGSGCSSFSINPQPCKHLCILSPFLCLDVVALADSSSYNIVFNSVVKPAYNKLFAQMM
jgi:hypothetical protein